MLVAVIVVTVVLLVAAPFVPMPRWSSAWGARLAFWQRQPVRERLRRRRPLLVAYAGLAGAGLLVLVIWVLPSLLTEHPRIDDAADRQTAITNTRGNLALLLTGLGAAGGLAFTARTHRLSQTGQLTDRYSKAVEQLGSEQIEVRLGGIYALERLMQDSPADQPTIVETLAAFVRQHVPRTTAPTTVKLDRRVAGRRRATASSAAKRPRQDVQAVLTVLGRRRPVAGDSPIDLSHTTLRGAVLGGAELTDAYLVGTDLTDAYLADAGLEGAELMRAKLTHTNLHSAKLHLADLTEADLTGAVLHFADLTNARLYGADLTNAGLYGTILTGSSPAGAVLPGAVFTDQNLSGINLQDAKLTGAMFARAVLTRSSFRHADLTDATLSAADLSDADVYNAKLTKAQLAYTKLLNADLCEADLTGANLTGAKLIGAQLPRANLTGANLTGADLTDADLADARIPRGALSDQQIGEARNVERIQWYGRTDDPQATR